MIGGVPLCSAVYGGGPRYSARLCSAVSSSFRCTCPACLRPSQTLGPSMGELERPAEVSPGVNDTWHNMHWRIGTEYIFREASLYARGARFLEGIKAGSL